MTKLIEVEQEVGRSATATLIQYADIAWRGKWVIIAAVVLSLTVGWIYCEVTPKLYRSETLILVADPKVPESYVQGIAEGKIEQRIFLIQKEINSRAFLGEVVKELNLYPDEVAEFGLDRAAAILAGSLMVEMVGKGPRGNFVSRSGLDAFTVSFVHPDTRTAMLVTDRVATRFIEENMKAREATAEGTSEFLDAEVLIVQKELERKEDEISRFKSQHMGKLPQQIETNLRALDRLPNDLNAVSENMQRLTDRLATVEKAIREYQRFGKTNPSLSTGTMQLDPLFRRLSELREKLVKLRAEFWDSYPEVLLTKEELRQVEQNLVESYGSDILKPGESPPDPYLQDLTKQQSELKSELALLKQRQQILYDERKEFQKRIEKSPEVEQDLLILERDYENMKGNYRSLLEKRLNARVAENLEKRQKGSQFRILDRASFPGAPVQPNQPRIMILAFLLGCALGVGVALMQGQLNPRFHRPEDIEHVLGHQLLAVIPDFSFELNRLNRYKRMSWQRLLPNYRDPGGANGQHNGSYAWTRRLKGMLGSDETDQLFDRSVLVQWWPNSMVAEQYRVAATRLALLANKGRSTVVAVTSAVKGEGKTTTVVNLGYTLARDLGKRTLLLDCDFKCPALNHYSEAVPQWGLADRLITDIPMERCLSGFGDVPCWIMPAGNCEVRSNELLKTERLAHILELLREQFEYILINTPPVLPMATMNVLAGHADLLLFVVRANSTPLQTINRAVSSLRVNTPIHLILNALTGNSLPAYMFDYALLQASDSK